ncbi:protein of unknown function [Burkholderia multivorans]
MDTTFAPGFHSRGDAKETGHRRISRPGPLSLMEVPR